MERFPSPDSPASPESAPSTRSIAGSVAPIAAVAGSNNRKLAPKVTIHCHHAGGSAPIQCSTASPTGCISTISASPHRPITASQARYPRKGDADRSIRPPKVIAPSASPPKNAVTTASTAAASKPSHSAHCCVQTIW
ncbi:hypothetical protein ACFJIX_27875 [Roseateles sp. UC29_93]|uniref:hypothetical protein n=1 Tax=Roseateles sp. UC29_93 TaxID=3350177 RepID=UPI00366BEFC4